MTMRYILMMHVPHSTGNYQISAWTPDALRSHMTFMADLNRDLTRSGEWVDGQGLAAPRDVRVVRADPEGRAIVSDGPFAESKEFLAGYWIVDVESTQRAFDIAGRASTAPGPNGKPLNMAIEVREILAGPPTEA